MTATSAAQPLVGVRYVGTRPYKDDNLLGRRGRRWRRGEVLKVPVTDAASYLKHPMVWAQEEEPWDAGAVQDEAPVGAPSDALVRMIEARDIEGLRVVWPDLANKWDQRAAELQEQHTELLKMMEELEQQRAAMDARQPLAEDEAVGAPSDALVRMIEAGDIEGLRLVRPDLADLWERRAGEVLEAERIQLWEALAEVRKERADMDARQPLAEDEAGRLAVHVPGLAKALVQGVSESVFAKVDFVMDFLMAYPPLLEATLEAERNGKARRDVLRRLTSMTHDMLREIEQRAAARAEEGPAVSDEPTAGDITVETEEAGSINAELLPALIRDGEYQDREYVAAALVQMIRPEPDSPQEEDQAA